MPRACAPQQEKPPQWEALAPQQRVVPQLDKAAPGQPKINKVIKKINYTTQCWKAYNEISIAAGWLNQSEKKNVGLYWEP